MQKRYAAAFDSLHVRYVKAYLLEHLSRARPRTIGRPSFQLRRVAIGLALILGMTISGHAQIHPSSNLKQLLDSLLLQDRPYSPAAIGALTAKGLKMRLPVALSQLFVIDTAIIDHGYGTSRHVYTYNAAGGVTSELAEDFTNGQWVNDYRYTTTYNASGNRVSYLGEEWANGQWVNSYRDTWSYNAQGIALSILVEEWVNNQWLTRSSRSSTYDENGVPISHLFEQYANGQLTSRLRITTTSPVNGTISNDLVEQWSDGQWVNLSRSTITSNASGRVMSWVQEDWSDGRWVNAWRGMSDYDIDGNVVSDFAEHWIDGHWVNSFRQTYTYDANGNELTLWSQTWELADPESGTVDRWVNTGLLTQTYDENGNKLTYVPQWWVDDQWMNDFRYRYSYDANRNMILGSHDQWQNSAWVPSGGSFDFIDSAGNGYSYSAAITIALHYVEIGTGVSSIEEESVPRAYALEQNYPNPFNPSTTISYALPQSSHVTLTICNTLGQQVATLVNGEVPAGVHEVRFDARGLASGVYVYRFTAGGFVQSRKLTLIR